MLGTYSKNLAQTSVVTVCVFVAAFVVIVFSEAVFFKERNTGHCTASFLLTLWTLPFYNQSLGRVLLLFFVRFTVLRLKVYNKSEEPNFYTTRTPTP